MKDKNKTSWIIAIVAIVILVSVVGYGLVNSLSKESFKANTILLKLNMITEGELTTDVKITNQQNTEQIFNVYFSGLDGIASVNDTQFSLEAGDWKNVKVYFKDSKNEVNVYVGYLVIETYEMTKKIPIVLTVEDVNPFFVVIQKPLANYADVIPGGKFGMEIKLFDLKSEDPQNIDVNYVVKNFEDEVLVSEDESLVVEKSVSISKIVDTPDSMNEGDYVFITSVNHNGKSIASYFFEVSKEKKGNGFSLGNMEYFGLLILVFVVGLFWMIFRFFESRDKLILQFQRQQRLELKNNLSVIRAYKKELKNIENLSERRIKLEKLEAQKKMVIDRIKLKHEKQKDEIKKYIASKKNLTQEKREKIKNIREKEIENNMVKRLKDWQRQGYVMSELKSNIKSIPSSRIANQVEAWKKQGYVLK